MVPSKLSSVHFPIMMCARATNALPRERDVTLRGTVDELRTLFMRRRAENRTLRQLIGQQLLDVVCMAVSAHIGDENASRRISSYSGQRAR